MNRKLVYLAFVLAARTATAAAPPTSLNSCQNAVKKATKVFVTNKVMALATCLQAVSTQVVQNNAPDAHAAAGTCVTQFRRINDSRGQDKQLNDKLAAAIIKKCAPGQPNVTHTLADIIGTGAGVPQPLDAENLNAWCSHYGGDGSIDSLQEWIDCLTAAAECDVDSTIASQYPRALEWMNLVKPSMQVLSPPAADPTKVIDAVAGLDAVKAEIDGPDNDNVVSIQCGNNGVCDASLAACNSSLGTCNSSLGACTSTLGSCNSSLSTCNGDLATCNANLAVAEACGNGSIDGGEQCDQSNLNAKTCVTQGFVGGTLKCGANCTLDTNSCYAARFVDNANGTITDNQSGLQWEKKVKLNSMPSFANLQDADNYYQWAGTCSVATSTYCQPTAAAATACAAGVEGVATGCAQCTGGDGICNASTTMWTWLAALNTASFGTHNDWRLPKRAELEGILDLADTSPPVINVAFQGASCGSACTDVTSAACACTRSDGYWSASTIATSPTLAWGVFFDHGNVGTDDKSSSYYVRAVRGGL